MVEGLLHILVHLLMVRIEDHGLWIEEVHEEAIFGQQTFPFG